MQLAAAGKEIAAQLGWLSLFSVRCNIHICDILRRRIFEAFLSKSMNHLVSIIRTPELIGMDKGIHTTKFHFNNIALRIKFRLSFDYDREATKKGLWIVNHRDLFP